MPLDGEGVGWRGRLSGNRLNANRGHIGTCVLRDAPWRALLISMRCVVDGIKKFLILRCLACFETRLTLMRRPRSGRLEGRSSA
jgi:hypothetical protein